MTEPVNIALITGSTRPGRNNEAVSRWVEGIAKKRTDAHYELVDIAAFDLPLYDEPGSPMFSKPTKPHTQAWSAKVASFDGYVFVTPEYNHSIPGALKNAIDFLYPEWNNKAAGFISYGGSAGGARGVEHLRLVMSELQVATVRAQVMLSLVTDFENWRVFKPGPTRETEVNMVFDQVVAWSKALKTVRG